MMIPPNITAPVWLLSWATFLNRSTGFLTLFAAMFFHATGFEESHIVAALFLCGGAGIVSSTIAGTIADRIGAKRVLIGGTILNIPVTLGLSFSDSPAAVIALAAVSVFLSQSFIPPASAIIALSAEGPDRVSMFAFYRIFINVGSIVAPAIVGIIGTAHFGTLFLISAGGYALTALLLVFFRREVRESEDKTTGHSGDSDVDGTDAPSASASTAAASSVWHPAALWVILVAMGITMVVYAQHQGAVPLAMADRPNGDRIFSSLLILNPVLIICCEYPLSYLTKKMHWATALAVGTAVMGVGVAIAGAFSAPFFAYFGWVLFSLGECVFAPMSNTAVAELSDREHISRNQGLLTSFQSAGMALGPALGTMIFFFSPHLLWTGVAITSVAVGVVIVLTGRLALSTISTGK